MCLHKFIRLQCLFRLHIIEFFCNYSLVFWQTYNSICFELSILLIENFFCINIIKSSLNFKHLLHFPENLYFISPKTTDTWGKLNIKTEMFNLRQMICPLDYKLLNPWHLQIIIIIISKPFNLLCTLICDSAFPINFDLSLQLNDIHLLGKCSALFVCYCINMDNVWHAR